MLISTAICIYLCVADNVFRVTVCWDFKFDPSHVVLGAESPESRLLDTLNALKLHHLEQKELKGHIVGGNRIAQRFVEVGMEIYLCSLSQVLFFGKPPIVYFRRLLKCEKIYKKNSWQQDKVMKFCSSLLQINFKFAKPPHHWTFLECGEKFQYENLTPQ